MINDEIIPQLQLLYNFNLYGENLFEKSLVVPRMARHHTVEIR